LIYLICLEIHFYFFRFLLYNWNMKKENQKPLLSDDEVRQVCECFKMGATNSEVALETGIDFDRLITWRAIEENCKLVESWKLQPTWEAKKTLTKKLREDEKTAQWYLTHNKETKADWSDRVELTGKDGKDLLPVPILNGIADDNKS